MSEMPKGLRSTERALWENGGDHMRAALTGLARSRNSAQNHAAELERVEAERDQLRQQVEKLISAVDAHGGQWDESYLPHGPDRKTETMLARIWDDDLKLYQAADQVRKELEG